MALGVIGSEATVPSNRPCGALLAAQFLHPHWERGERGRGEGRKGRLTYTGRLKR